MPLFFLVELQTSSRFKGVSLHKKNDAWQAAIYIAEVGIYLVCLFGGAVRGAQMAPGYIDAWAAAWKPTNALELVYDERGSG